MQREVKIQLESVELFKLHKKLILEFCDTIEKYQNEFKNTYKAEKNEEKYSASLYLAIVTKTISEVFMNFPEDARKFYVKKIPFYLEEYEKYKNEK